MSTKQQLTTRYTKGICFGGCFFVAIRGVHSGVPFYGDNAMISISGSDINMTRGDTLLVRFIPTKDGETYDPMTGDVIRFAMKRKATDADVLIEKDIPTDTFLLELEPSDTKSLDMNKRYVYDVELTDAYGRVDTYVSGQIRLTTEVE